MNYEEIVRFFDHFSEGLYVRTIAKPFIHGMFTDREKLDEAIRQLDDSTTLYFIAHSLNDSTEFPYNCFEKIPKNGSVKLTDLSIIKYFILDIDPNNSTEVIDGKNVKRNLTVKENQAVLDDAMAVKKELLDNGFDNIGVINSGNGAYLVFPFRGIPITEDCTVKTITDNFKKFAQILKQRVRLRHSSIDFNTLKLSQCFKTPGTLSTKGIETQSNPYRHACIVEDWNPENSCLKMIQDYTEAYDNSELVYTDSYGTHLDIEKCVERCEKEFPVFCGENHDYYARVSREGKIKDMLITSADFRTELRLYLRKETGFTIIESGVLDAIITCLCDVAYQCDKSAVASRAYYDKDENVVFYDLCNDKDVVKITADSIEVVMKPLGMFVKQPGDIEQVSYVTTSADKLPKLLGSIAKLSPNDCLILASFLCSCFLGSFFPMPILLITGPQGSSKSSLTRAIQRIVHPQRAGLLSLLEKKEDIAIALSRRLITCFDNATGVKAEISDMLCTAVTKGVYQKRELYTTKDECLIEYTSIMVINGIDVVSRRTDLMERCIMLEMSPIKPEERKTESELENAFNSILPSILGAIFNTIQRALAMDKIKSKTLSRMADFESWSVKFAVAMGYSPEEYQVALQENIKNLVDAVSFGNPTVFAVVELMRGKSDYTCGFQEFYHNCDDILQEKMTVSEKSTFPKSPAAFSRALGGMTKILESFGISFEVKNIGPNKEITIWNNGTVIGNKSQAEKVGKIVYENLEKEIADMKAAEDANTHH